MTEEMTRDTRIKLLENREDYNSNRLTSMNCRIDQLERRNDAHITAIKAALDCIYDLAITAGDDDLKDAVRIITKTLSTQLGDI